MTRKLMVTILCLSAGGGLLLGCKPQPAADVRPAQPATVELRIGDELFTCEIAADESSRRKGLMFRNHLPENRGMIFVFNREQVLRFWMKNTYIPLDILYLDSAGKIVAIRQMKPLDTNGVSSKSPARYAVELNAGAAERAKVREGDAIPLPPLGGD